MEENRDKKENNKNNQFCCLRKSQVALCQSSLCSSREKRVRACVAWGVHFAPPLPAYLGALTSVPHKAVRGWCSQSPARPIITAPYRPITMCSVGGSTGGGPSLLAQKYLHTYLFHGTV